MMALGANGMGCGVQDLLQDKDLGKDLSGNKILADVGPWLRDELKLACKVPVHPLPTPPPLQAVTPAHH